ncbi:Rtf2 RING-finger-domain-containing protein [Mycena haematopus]|nr:Rtf2 RING-finger-domain-containing protein [Mycena haematopus]
MPIFYRTRSGGLRNKQTQPYSPEYYSATTTSTPVDRANQNRARWNFCALSKRRLQEPVVSCALGKLYNKDAVIEFLLDRDAYGDGENICGHIRSLKRPQFVCPLTLKEMNGTMPFVYLRPCGCVFSAAGLNALRSTPPDGAREGEKDTCPQCAAKYSHSADCVPLNPTLEEEERLVLLSRRSGCLSRSKKGTPAAPSIATASNSLRSTLAMEEAKRKAGMSDAVKALYSAKDNARKRHL